ncbi:MAG: hypothetical protein IPH78_08400 [Bacteroidetes bacterium]|nr:hypothetical protein [Bacteroidota bacterium]
MKYWIAFLSGFFLSASYAQSTAYLQAQFCQNLNKVLESGRMENFESLQGATTKQSPMLQVPGYAVKLPGFPVVYVDKDSRFVGKTLLNMDSASAQLKLQELKGFVGHCLDSVQWTAWTERPGNDSTTLFFNEETMLRTTSREFILDLAIVKATEKVRSIHLYIRRK